MKHIDSEFMKLQEDLNTHKNGILEKLEQILIERYAIEYKSYSILENLSEAKSIDWDAQIVKGDKVNVNKFMVKIMDDMTKMYKVLSNLLP